MEEPEEAKIQEYLKLLAARGDKLESIRQEEQRVRAHYKDSPTGAIVELEHQISILWRFKK